MVIGDPREAVVTEVETCAVLEHVVVPEEINLSERAAAGELAAVNNVASYSIAQLPFRRRIG
jgi:hypothetical protein